MSNESQNQTVVRAIVLVACLIVIGVICLGIWGPTETDRTDRVIAFMATTLVLVTTALGGYRMVSDTKQIAHDAKAAAVEGTAISTQNAAALVTVDEKVTDVHAIVNARDTALHAELAALRQAGEVRQAQLAELRAAGDHRQRQLDETRAALTKLTELLHNERAGRAPMPGDHQ